MVASGNQHPRDADGREGGGVDSGARWSGEVVQLARED